MIECSMPESISAYFDAIQQQVTETQEEFIFNTINNYIGTITEMKISKEELTRAISLIRMQRTAMDTYGVQISRDWDTAQSQMHDLERAYNCGFEAGIKKERERIDNAIKEIV